MGSPDAMPVDAGLDGGRNDQDASPPDPDVPDVPDAGPIGEFPRDLHGNVFTMPVWSLSLAEDVLLAGVPDSGVPGRGMVSVFERSCNEWSEVTRLYSDDQSYSPLYGYSVAASGTVAVVGSFLELDKEDRLIGAAYVYERTSTGAWERVQRLREKDTKELSRFGVGVAIHEDTILVGAPAAGVRSQGFVYVFERSGGAWEPTARLAASPAVPSSNFGASIAMSGDTIIVGDDDHDGAGWISGAAYVFVKKDGHWSQQAFLPMPEENLFAQCGYSVAIWQDTAAVGCPGEDVGSGSVRVFTRTNGRWTQTSMLTPADRESGDHFGISVKIHESRLVVGSYGDDGGGTRAGAAHIYEWSDGSWLERDKISGTKAGLQLGYAVDVAPSLDTWVIGSMAEEGVTPSASIRLQSGSRSPGCP